jgi:hypothetical protein
MASIKPPSAAEPRLPELDKETEKEEQQLSSPVSEDLEPESKQVPEPATTAPVEQEEQWVTGIKLLNIITAVSLVCLLMLLDVSIVSTV